MTSEEKTLPIGWTTSGQPVWALRGAAIEFAVGDDEGDDPEFDDEQDEDDDEQDDEQDDDEDTRKRQTSPRARRSRTGGNDGDDDGDFVPPTREAWERVQSALKRANGEAGKRRRVGKVMDRLGIDDLETWMTQRGLDPESGEPFGSDVVSPDDEADDDGYQERERERDDRRDSRSRDRETARQIRTAEQRGRAAERDRLIPALMEQSARLALRDAGFSGTKQQLDRMLRSIDPRDLDFDDDEGSFELLGMDEEIERLQDDFPDYFGGGRDEDERPRRRGTKSATSRTATTSRARGARDVDGGSNRGRQPSAPRGWAEQAVEQMMNNRR
jgi:hypothetical protein